MVGHLVSRRASPYRVGALSFALLVLVWTSPSEQTIGDLVKVVYIHGALVRAAEVVFLAGGALGLIYLLRKSASIIAWLRAMQGTAFLFWLFSFLISIYVMQMAWGGINWTEPRFLSSGRVLAVAAIAIALCFLFEKPKVTAAAGVLVGIVVVVELATAGVQLHPTNPIGTSPSIVTKLSYYAITLLTLLLAAETSRLFLPGMTAREVGKI